MSTPATAEPTIFTGTFVYVPGSKSRTARKDRTPTTATAREYTPLPPRTTTIGELANTQDTYVVTLANRTMTLRNLRRVSRFNVKAMMKTGPSKAIGQSGPSFWSEVTFAPSDVVTSWDPNGELPELKESWTPSIVVTASESHAPVAVVEPPDYTPMIFGALDHWADDGGPPQDFEPLGPDVVTITPPLPAIGCGSRLTLIAPEFHAVLDLDAIREARLHRRVKNQKRSDLARYIKDFETLTAGQKAAAVRQCAEWLADLDEASELATRAYA